MIKTAEKYSNRILIAGGILVMLGFITIFLSLFNLYGKAGSSNPCLNNCTETGATPSVASNQLLLSSGKAIIIVGIITIIVGAALSIHSRSQNKR
ncbi:MAG TPA: hypothetical protein VLG47_01175 [Candidatus Saccharimonadales bacterium]|nr:hypothetical protein [Candidatus Saccharimonadales bacterium]